MTAVTPNVAGQYLTFALAQELFAVDIHAVREIIEYGHLTSVPMMPPSILGVINLRGAVVPVIDLGLRFGGSATSIGPRTCIVILEIAAGDGLRVIGMVVDAVSEVIDIPAEQIEPPPSFGSAVRRDFIQGMGKMAAAQANSNTMITGKLTCGGGNIVVL